MAPDRREVEFRDQLEFVIEGVARADDVHDIIREFGPLGRFSESGAGEAILGLAADAIVLGRFCRSDLLEYVSLRERFLPEVEVSGRNENYKSDWILRTAPTLAAGVDPGIEDQLRFWQVMDLERWAIHAFVAYVRAAAEHIDVSVHELCSTIAERNGVDLSE